MGVAVFFLLAAIAAGAIIYPLLPGRRPIQPSPVVSDDDIERAVLALREAPSQDGLYCPSCAMRYQAGDRFCVRCGGELPHTETVAAGPTCAKCGVPVREGDRFCPKCGHNIAAGEAA